jgi:small subunit ribosomal protein S6
MTKRSYEIMVAFDPAVAAVDVDQVLAKLKQIIVDAGGEVKSADKHGVRKLAFKLRGKADALFCLIVCDAPVVVVKQVSDALRLNEGVLRYMTTRSTLPTKPAPASPAVAGATVPGSGGPKRADAEPGTPVPGTQ